MVDISTTSDGTESIGKSSRVVVDPVGRSDIAYVASFSSSLGAYEGDEVRKIDYAWVDNRVCEVFSKFRQPSMLQTFVDSVDILLEGTPDGILFLRRCREYKTVCLGKGSEPKDFFLFLFLLDLGHSCPLSFR